MREVLRKQCYNWSRGHKMAHWVAVTGSPEKIRMQDACFVYMTRKVIDTVIEIERL